MEQHLRDLVQAATQIGSAENSSARARVSPTSDGLTVSTDVQIASTTGRAHGGSTLSGNRILLIIGGGRPEFYPTVAGAVKEAGKPAVLVRPIFRFPEEAQLVATNNLLTYTDGRRAAVALAKLAEYASFVNGRK